MNENQKKLTPLTPSEVFGVIKRERVYQDRDLVEKDWDHKGFP